MKKKFCVIGLGRFGSNVAQALYNDGHEVIAIDMDKDRVQRAGGFCSYAIVGDAGNKDFLHEQGIADVDAVVVSTGDRSHLATLITLHLKELGVPRVVVKAVDEDHGRILEKVGASQIIFPEKDMALKTARGLSSPNFLEFIPLAEDYSISEVEPLAEFVGRTLIELDLRRRFDVTVIAVKDSQTGDFQIVPPANYQIKPVDLLILIGHTADIAKALRRK